MDESVLLDEKAREAAHAAKNAVQAAELARKQQTVEIIIGVRDEILEPFLKKVTESLTYEGGDRPSLVARIPVICNDIRWIKWFVMGIAAGIGGLVIIYIVK